MSEQLLMSLLLCAAGGAAVTLCSLKMLQIFQLCSYQAGGFFRWLRRTNGDYPIRYFSLGFFQFISLLIFSFSFPSSRLRFLGLTVYFGLAIFFIILNQKQRKKQKTPLKVTKRMARLIASVAVVSAGLCFVSVYFTFDYAIGVSIIAAVSVLIPLVVALCHFVMLPVETAIKNGYKRKAKRTLSGGIIKVGITGSFGKTTAKNILTAMLSAKFRVLASPASHNTPMGICKLVGGGVDGYDVLIAEMGARHSGDIAELCEFILPDHGIITVTGAQHLETFGDLDTVVRTKMELARYARGIVVLNSDDERLVGAASELIANADNTNSYRADVNNTRENSGVNDASNLNSGENSGVNGVSNLNSGENSGVNSANARNAGANNSDKTILSGKISSDYAKQVLFSGSAGANASFENVRVGKDGTSFTLVVDGARVEIVTRLLGRHIPSLFAQCALLSCRMGVTLSEIKAAAESVQPVEHRLQLIKTKDCTIIDDAYNSNPEGARNALEVLSLFGGVRVVVTPGFVEMGETQREENRKLGGAVATAADYLFAVGCSDIASGALDAGMDRARVFEADSLSSAMERLSSLSLSAPTILFLNDLPDTY